MQRGHGAGTSLGSLVGAVLARFPSPGTKVVNSKEQRGVLVVEDDPAIRRLVKMVLQREGYATMLMDLLTEQARY